LPWNYPVVIWAWRIGAILASGSTAVVKPAEQTPYSAVLLQDICSENLPSGVVCTVLGGEETGKSMVSASFDCIAFTGSTAVGREISNSAFPAKTSLELGGNGPVIFFDDAPGRAAKDIAAAALYNNGQSCAAPARVIAVGKAAFGRAVKELTEEFSSVPTNMPSIGAQQAERVESYIAETSGDVVRGTTTQEAGKEDWGYWVKPALVINPSPMDDVVSCEVFGPVLTVQLASDLKQAVEMANMFGPGLSGSVWGSDLTNIKVCEQSMDVGEVWVNCHLAQTPEIPHPGRGLSGNGADMGADAIREYQHVKAVHERYAR
jgi:acyl-CoA reductase-like NAD-dependent aldehyde dehydrogenase